MDYDILGIMNFGLLKWRLYSNYTVEASGCQESGSRGIAKGGQCLFCCRRWKLIGAFGCPLIDLRVLHIWEKRLCPKFPLGYNCRCFLLLSTWLLFHRIFLCNESIGKLIPISFSFISLINFRFGHCESARKIHERCFWYLLPSPISFSLSFIFQSFLV